MTPTRNEAQIQGVRPEDAPLREAFVGGYYRALEDGWDTAPVIQAKGQEWAAAFRAAEREALLAALTTWAEQQKLRVLPDGTQEYVSGYNDALDMLLAELSDEARALIEQDGRREK